MVHCISSSEPDSGDLQNPGDDWRIQGITTKELTLSQVGLQHGKTYVESTVTTGIQVGNHRVSPVTRGFTVDLHQPADTTHPENTYVDSQENMDTSSPNHSTDITNIKTTTTTTIITTSDSNNSNSLSNNPQHYQSVVYPQQNCIAPPDNDTDNDNDNVYCQQQQQQQYQNEIPAPDHADYTHLPGNKLTRGNQESLTPHSLDSFVEGETTVMEVQDGHELNPTLELNPQSYKYRNDSRHQEFHRHNHNHSHNHNPQFQQLQFFQQHHHHHHHHHHPHRQHLEQQNLLEQRQLGSISRNAVVSSNSNGETYLLPATVTSQKVINFNNAGEVGATPTTPALYRHLYDLNCRSDPNGSNGIAVVDYHHHYHHHNPNSTNKTLFVVGNSNNQFGCDDQSEDDSDDSSDDE